MQKFDLKKLFNEGFGWTKDFKFEIIFSNSGVARIFINDKKTKYKASGYGYDKVSSVIASMINDLIEKQPYNSEIYGNSGNYKKEGETEFHLSMLPVQWLHLPFQSHMLKTLIQFDS